MANFLSYFAIAVVEFAVPFVAVTTLGGGSAVIAVLGICRFAPQVLLARTAANVVSRYDQRWVMLASEVLRALAFALAAATLLGAPELGIAVFALANAALGFASVLTAVSIQVLVPATFTADELPAIFARLSIAESLADGLAPFLTGVGLASLGVPPTFAVSSILALFAGVLLLHLPKVRVPDAKATPKVAGVNRSSVSMRDGLRCNLTTPALRIVTAWAVAYNFGQSIVVPLLLIALLERTPVTASTYGAIGSTVVLFAVLGAYLSDKLPAPLQSGLGMSLTGFGAAASYALLGIGVYIGGLQGLIVVILALAADEFCSGVVLVRVFTFRATVINQADRAAATAAYRALNTTVVPIGLAVGGLLGLFFSPASTLLIVGLMMILPGLIMMSAAVRQATS